MHSIYKYTLAIRDEQTVHLPVGAKVLSAQVQHEELCLWALVDPDARAEEPRTFRIHGTGHRITDAGRLTFIGTAQMRAGQLVWHVFEVK